MLIEFKCKNHKAIKNEITLSFIAAKSPVHDKDRMIVTPKPNDYNLLKSAAIFGPNGSGKSTIIDAISYMRFHVLNPNATYPHFDLIQQTPNNILSSKIESTYSIQFIKNNIRYCYGLVLKEHKIVGEYLYHFPKGRAAKVFDRIENKVTYGRKFRTGLRIPIFILNDSISLLASIGNKTEYQPLKDTYDFFKNDLIIYDPLDVSIYGNIDDGGKNPKLKKIILGLLSSFDTGIKDMKYDDGHIKTVYDNFEINLSQEGTGIKYLITLFTLYANAILQNKVLIVDNLETGIHPNSLYALLRLFLYSNPGNTSQLLFTTHSDMFLDRSPLRRDEIWFTEIDRKTRSMKLYSLVEFTGITDSYDFRNGYLVGRFGGIPNIIRDMYDNLSSDLEA